MYSIKDISGSDFVKVKVQMCGDKYLYLMIDNGASISIFNQAKINRDQLVNLDENCLIKGVTSGEIRTIGKTATNLLFENGLILSHEFQILPQKGSIEVDGILGRDFLLKYKASIDYSTYLLTLNFGPRDRQPIPLYDVIDDSFLIPARSEVIRRLDLSFGQPTMIFAQEIENGIFVSNSIVDGNSCYVRVLNVGLEPKLIRHFEPKIAPISEYFVMDSSKYDKIKKIYSLKPEDEFGLNSRLNRLSLELDLNNVPTYGKEMIWNLCSEFNDIFHLEGDFLTTNSFYRQKIALTDRDPIFTRNYRQPQVYIEEIDKQVQNLLEMDIIEPSCSPYNSPLLLVPKKGSKDQKRWRLVVDFRKINKKVVSDVFPLPRIEEILDQLGRAKYFSVLDLKSGFHQVEIEPNSREITAFSTSTGHYHFKRSAFGFKNSPVDFQRMMTIAMSGLSPEACFLYIDDLVVFGCSLNHHQKNLMRVFEALRKYNLKLNPAKCQFLQTDVTYLGHHITNNGILPDPSKFSVIRQYPVPENVDDVRRFVSFCNYYRRFVENFAKIANPLYRLLRKNVPFVWTQSCQVAFDTLKQKLMEPPILQYPDFTKEFRLRTDASDIACGAVLSQIVDGHDLPICYASTAFNKADKHKHPSLKECIAIHWAIEFFKPYLYGRKFTIYTDHKPLVYLFNMKNPTSKLTRIRLDLEMYDFDIEYIRGKDNVCADALSRIKLNSDDLRKMNVFPVTTRSMARKNTNVNSNQDINQPLSKPVELQVYTALTHKEARKYSKLCFEIRQNSGQNGSHMIDFNERNKMFTLKVKLYSNHFADYVLGQALEFLEKIADEVGVHRLKIELKDELFNYVDINKFKDIGNGKLKKLKIAILPTRTRVSDDDVIDELILNYHNSLIGGHVGVTRLLNKISEKYVFRNMKRRIQNFISQCKTCKVNKHSKGHTEPTQITDTPDSSFATIAIDTVGPLNRSYSGNRYILTIQDELTKYIIFVPIQDSQSKTIAKAFIDNFILTFGSVNTIKTDLGTEYINSLFKDITELLKIEHRHSTPYHPQTIGALERNHRTFNQFVRSYVNDELNDWDEYVKYYEFCFNTTPCVSTGYTPFELVFGRKVRLPMDLRSSDIHPLYNHDDYAKELKYKLQTAHARAHELLHKSKIARKIDLDSKINHQIQFQINDKVMLPTREHSKLEPVRDGPWQILQFDGPNAYIRNLSNGKEKWVHKNLLTRY